MEKSNGLTMVQKILSAHCVKEALVEPGETIVIDVDWILASELALAGMERTLQLLGSPKLHAPDRFFLAIDHTVDPVTLRDNKRTKELVQLSREFALRHKVKAFYQPNETIMHTRFYRRHCVPGSVIVGADSHTTSHGAMSAFSIGLGGADVAVAAATGQTWIKVPEEVLVRLTGELPYGVTGKDISLAILKKFGSNKLLLDKVIEFREDDKAPLTTDAKFTVCNMVAEMGGITGIFNPTAEMVSFYEANRDPNGIPAAYYTSDVDAKYSYVDHIELSELEPLVALPFSPDNVAPVVEHLGQPFDGCFIGACTTTEEEIILSAFLLKAMMENGHTPESNAKRLIIPGDLAIRKKLEDLQLIEIFSQAGFRVGVPGCHMCLGLGSERASPGETWLSSQNRNYRNRMGAGSIAWLASGITVAASSFSMTLTDPWKYMPLIDKKQLRHALRPILAKGSEVVCPQLREPVASKSLYGSDQKLSNIASCLPVHGRALMFGNNIDTDAIIPGEFCTETDSVFLGAHCFHYVRPDFQSLVQAGQNIVIAGDGWGCGSSREHAAWALKGSGIKAVIAKSFGTIHLRNLINEGIPAFTVKDKELYNVINDGDELLIDIERNKIDHAATGLSFALLAIPEALMRILSRGGIVPDARAKLESMNNNNYF